MTTADKYKVLWVDDDKSIVAGTKLDAEEFNLELVHFTNWEEAEYELKRNFDEFSAIILDANCKIRKTDTEQEEFITAVLPSLTNIFGEKRQVLPWYLMSAGTMSDFSRIVNGARYQHSKHEEDWGDMLYLKHAPDGDAQNPANLFANIQRVAKDQAMNTVLYRHCDVFCYLGTDKLIDSRARRLMLRMLSALYYPEENIKYEFQGNPLRKVVEYLFRSAHNLNLLPDECFSGDDLQLKLQLASLFMAGSDVSYDNTDKSKGIRWGVKRSEKDKDSIFDSEIADIVKKTLYFANSDSHTSEEEPWFIEEERKDIFFGFVLQMCHVIKWYGKFAEEHSDPIENAKNINPVIIKKK